MGELLNIDEVEALQNQIKEKLERIKTLETVLNWDGSGTQGPRWKALYIRHLDLQFEVMKHVCKLEGITVDADAGQSNAG